MNLTCAAQSASIILALVGCGRVSKRHIEAVQATKGVVCDIDENNQ